jgi:hypothetical protein
MAATLAEQEEYEKSRLRALAEEYIYESAQLKQNRCFESIRRLNAFLVAVAIMVFVLILVAWPTWYNAEVFGAPILYIFILQIPISALNDLYACEVLFVFIMTYTGLIFYFFIIDFLNFTEIFKIIGDNMSNIAQVCSQPYCRGWQAYVFFIYYWFLMLNLLLLLLLDALFLRIFYLDYHAKNMTRKRVRKQTVEDIVSGGMKKVYPYLQDLNNKLTSSFNTTSKDDENIAVNKKD